MLRKILALLAGFVTFFILISILQFVSASIYGMPNAEAMSGDRDAMSAFIASMPTSAFLVLAFAYVLGSSGAGFVMRKISRSDSILLPLIIGGFGTLAWAYNTWMYAHPIWMVVLGFFCFIPFALIGHKVARS